MPRFPDVVTASSSATALRRSVAGCLLGTALGDAIGLPAEGLSRERQQALLGAFTGHRLLPGRRGMYSDDTEHTCLVAQALIVSAGSPDRFSAALARGLRAWLLLLPAGAGRATLSACLRLLFGASPFHSGVFSAGNGPAMRSALIGVCYGSDLAHLRSLVSLSTRITHTDPRAAQGALVVALAAHRFATGNLAPDQLLTDLRQLLAKDDAEPLLDRINDAVASVNNSDTTERFAALIGCGEAVSGYVLHTVPVALHAALRYPDDFRAAVLSAVRCGGDTDTVAAITGALVGARVGPQGIPSEWRTYLWEWPRGLSYLEQVSARLAAVVQTEQAQSPVPASVPGIALRNLFFLAVVLIHGLRRLLPPY